MKDANELLAAIAYAARSRGSKAVSIFEVVPPYVTDTRRGSAANGKAGRITIAVHDDFVRSVTGLRDKALWRLFLVAIPGDAMREKDSPIILPGSPRA